jgi:RIO kinase 1
LSLDKLRECYLELIIQMRVLYQKCKLVHGDLSEYNILYFEVSFDLSLQGSLI